MGEVGNDGTDNTTFAEAVRASAVSPPTTIPRPFRGGAYRIVPQSHRTQNPQLGPAVAFTLLTLKFDRMRLSIPA